MKNETKRDVFLESADKCAGYNDELYNQYTQRYDVALPDDLPVIPKAVGEMLQSAHWQTDLLGVLDTAKNGYKISETLEWIYSNQNVFARAWLDGYMVEDYD